MPKGISDSSDTSGVVDMGQVTAVPLEPVMELNEGFQYGAITVVSAQNNMLSATRNPQVVDEYLEKAVRLGRVVGPFDQPGSHIHKFGVIEKPHQSGEYRLIVDLSYPEGYSVNDGLEPEICTLNTPRLTGPC